MPDTGLARFVIQLLGEALPGNVAGPAVSEDKRSPAFPPAGPADRRATEESSMKRHNNEFDLTNAVNMSYPDRVAAAVKKIGAARFEAPDFAAVDHAFGTVASLYDGKHPGYLACDTDYHDLRHALDVTLAMARLMDGYASTARRDAPLGAESYQLGLIVALFHDVGYLRHKHDRRHRNGAEYAATHVSRSAEFLHEYLPQVGLRPMVKVAEHLVHFTGEERAVAKTPLPLGIYRALGHMLGTADLLAQLSDRCYLEKCRDRLYPEFVASGRHGHRVDGVFEIVYGSADELVIKTPGFYQRVRQRLDETLHGAYRFAAAHFNGANPYIELMEKNMRYADEIARTGDTRLLRRKPPGRPRLVEVPA